jgi:drug/metabolite transporter (DMT)-like permease
MSGEIIALLTTVCWSIGIFPFTEASQRIGAAAVNQYRLLLAWVIISVLLFVFYNTSITNLFSSPQSKHYLFLGLSGIIGFTIGDYCSFKSFTLLGPKLGSLYTTFAPGAALLAGFLILNESVNLIGITGIIITLSGVIWLTLSKKDRKAAIEAGFKRNSQGIWLGIAGAFCQGLGLVLSKLGMDAYAEKLPTMHAVWIRLLFAFSAAFILSALTGSLLKNAKPVLKNQNNVFPFMLIGTIFGPIAGVTLSLLAIEKLEVAVAQTIFALLPIVVLPLNLLIYKEKITVQSVFACMLAIAGVMLLIWRNSISF